MGKGGWVMGFVSASGEGCSLSDVEFRLWTVFMWYGHIRDSKYEMRSGLEDALSFGELHL